MGRGIRKQLITDYGRADHLGHLLSFLSQSVNRHLEEGAFEDLYSKIQKLKECLKEELKAQPIGYMYKGVYYKKNPDHMIISNSAPEFEKMEGTLYMREDLVTWYDDYPNGYYIKNVCKTPNINDPLLREDGKPIFDISELKS